jgi:hypothetical protein
MPYALIDDQMYDHPKFVGLSDGAVGLWVRCLSWTARHLTDGHIPAALPGKLCTSSERTARRFAAELVDSGLWVAAQNGYQFHDYHHHNPSGSAVKARRAEVSEARSQAGRKGAEARWGHGKPDGKPMANGMANEWQSDDPVPVPVPPLANGDKSTSPTRSQLPTEEAVGVCATCDCATDRPGTYLANGVDTICTHETPSAEAFLA